MLSRTAPNKRAAPYGTTLVELTVATAIMTTIFAALMPLFVGIRNSVQTRWAHLEMVQNARVLNEQLGRSLAQAGRIVAVSARQDERGFIEFEVQDVVYRCAVGTGGYIEFGPIGRTQQLAGPVEYLRFACYNAADLDTPVQTPDTIRLVDWEAGFRSEGHLTPNKAATGACCLRVGPGRRDK
jgi:type II secretory pathway pseudopilin PulG